MNQRAIVATMAVAVMSLTLLTTGLAQAQSSSDILSITYIQLGGAGDSTLIQTPNDKTILVDGGLKRDYAGTIKPLLDDLNINTIDLIIATHKDQDHLNGINGLLEADEITVDAIWFSPEIANTTTVTTPFYNSVERKNIPLTFPTTGHTTHLDPNIHIEVLSPNEIRQFSEDNENSITTLIEYNDIEFLFTGDIKGKAEQWLINNIQGDKLDIDIMNAPHHGGSTSSTAAFIAATSPELVIFSADEDNRYDHPHQATRDRYASSNIDQLQTGTEGHINIQTDGTKCSIIFTNGTEAACFDGVLKLSEQDATQNPTQQPPTPTIPDAIVTLLDIIDGLALQITELDKKFGELSKDSPGPTVPAIPDSGNFIPIYYSATDEYNIIQKEYFEDQGFLERFTDRLTQTLALPHDVYLTMDECGESNAFYYPALKEITICYEFVTLLEYVLDPYYATDEELFQQVDEFMAWIMLHELGHALVDAYDLPITGKEEDAVDQFATIISLEYIPDGQLGSDITPTLNAWLEFALLDPPDFGGVHSLDIQRFYNVACWTYGSDPIEYSDLAVFLPPDRIERCQSEYGQMAKSWYRLVSPFLLQEGSVPPPQ